MERKLKEKIEKILKRNKREYTPTMVYTIYYIVSLKTDDVPDEIIDKIYLFINRYIKEGVALDWIFNKIKSAYEYNKAEGKKIDKVISYVKRVLDNKK